MNKKLAPIVCVLAIILGVLAPTEKTWSQAEDFSLGGFVFGQLAKAKQHFENSREACHAFADEIQGVRENYYRALRSGQGVESARSELYRELDAKDFGVIGIYVISGKDSVQAKTYEAACPPGFFVQPKLAGAFFDLVEELRSDMGATSRDDVVLLLDPTKLVDAIRAQHQRANAYVHARNLLEIYASGVPMQDLFSAEAYLKILLEMENSLPSLTILKPDMDKVPQEHFDLAVEVFGKQLVMEAAETVLKLPKTKEGVLVNMFSADQVHGTNDIFGAFIDILKTEPKGFVIFAKRKGRIRNWTYNVSTGAEYYDELVSRYGKNRVHEVVESLRAAPRIYGGKITVPDGAGYKTESDTWFLEKLLTDPTFRIADDKDFVYLAAGDIEAISKAKDKIQVIYGRVNDVRWADGGRTNNLEVGGYFHVYFAGVSKFGVMIYDHHFGRSRRYFGDDAQGLIGELIRVQGVVWQSQGRKDDSIRPDWSMRGRDGYFWALPEEEWPDYLAIPAMEPARSLDELRAAVTHVEVEPASEPPEDQRVAVRALAEASKVSPLKCRDSGPQRKGDISKLTPGVGMGHYFYRIAPYAKPVAHYEAYSEVCSRELNSVRDDFLLAAFGDLDDEYSVQLATHVENEYQAYCVIRFDSRCDQAYFELVKSKYEEVMTVLKSGDLQRERDRLTAHEESRTTKEVQPVSQSRATEISRAATVRPRLPSDWKKHAKVVGKYEALNEVCSGETEPAIRDDFLTSLEDATDDQATELTAMIDSSYDTQIAARQRTGKPCNDQMLQRLQKQYQGVLTAMAGE